MPIPAFNQLGLLPEGTHDCDVTEAQKRFGSFQGSDRRSRLWAKFMDFVRLAKTDRFIEELLIDGSFVTAKPDPNDIDVIVVVPMEHDFGADLPPHQHELLAARRVRRRFGFDMVVVKKGTENQAHAVEFFTQVRQRPGQKKGLLRIKL
jgi:hypothetical protein